MALRLVKVAKTLNISTSRIVDSLKNKGYFIENKPTSRITHEQHILLQKEFSGENLKQTRRAIAEHEYSSKLARDIEFEPETVSEFCTEFSISFLEFKRLARKSHLQGNFHVEYILNQDEVVLLRTIFSKGLKKELELKSKYNIERGTTLETSISHLHYPSGIEVRFTDDFKGFVPSSQIGSNFIESQLFLRNAKLDDRLELVVYDIDSIQNICYLSRSLHPNKTKTKELNIGDLVRPNLIEKLHHLSVVSLQNGCFGLVRNNLQDVYKIIKYDRYNDIYTLSNDQLNETTPQKIQLDKSDLIKSDLKDYGSFLRSSLGACATENEKELIQRGYSEVDSLFSKTLFTGVPLKISFIRNRAWDAFTDGINGSKVYEELNMLASQAFWITYYSQDHDYIQLYNETFNIKVVVKPSDDQIEYTVVNFSKSRLDRNHTRIKGYATNNGSLTFTGDLHFVDPLSTVMSSEKEVADFLMIKTKFNCFNVIKKLRRRSGEILKSEGESLKIFESFLKYQIELAESKEVEPIEVLKIDLLPSITIQGNFNLTLKQIPQDDFSEFEICQRIVQATGSIRFKVIGTAFITSKKDNVISITTSMDRLLDIGTVYIKPKISVRHLKQQEELIQKFFSKKLNIDHIEKLLVEGGKIKPPRSEKVDFHNSTLKTTLSTEPSNKQIEAVLKGVGNRNIVLIQGPPGTGKTTVIAEIIHHLLDKGERILVSSQGHVAVDNVLDKLTYRSDKLIARIGSEDKISTSAQNYHIDGIISKYFNDYRTFIKNQKEILKSYQSITQEDVLSLVEHYPPFLQEYFRNHHINLFNSINVDNKDKLTQSIEVLTNWEENLSSGFEELIKPLVYSQLDIVFGTCLGLKNHRNLETYNLEFDTLILDEAGKANMAESIVALSMAKKVILVGDQKQLPPYLDSSLLDPASPISFTSRNLKKHPQDKVKSALSISFFEYVYKRMEIGKFPVSNLIMLTMQHRMHPVIGSLVSEAFYNSQVQNADHTTHNVIKLKQPFDKEIIFLNTSNDKNPYERFNEDSLSYTNQLEATYIAETIIPDLLTEGVAPSQFAVISPYTAQVKLIKQFVENDHVDIETLDSFQGKEYDIIIISFTRSQNRKKVGFLDDARRLNVAFSRAKKKLILVGNSKTLCDRGSHFDFAFNYTSFFRKVVNICKNKGKLFDITVGKLRPENAIRVGGVFEGRIKNIVPYGLFVDFNYDHTGLIHESKMVNYSVDKFTIGQSVKIKIINISNDKIDLASYDYWIKWRNKVRVISKFPNQWKVIKKLKMGYILSYEGFLSGFLPNEKVMNKRLDEGMRLYAQITNTDSSQLKIYLYEKPSSRSSSEKSSRTILLCQYVDEDSIYYRVILNGKEFGYIKKDERSLKKIESLNNLPKKDRIYSVFRTDDFHNQCSIFKMK